VLAAVHGRCCKDRIEAESKVLQVEVRAAATKLKIARKL